MKNTKILLLTGAIAVVALGSFHVVFRLRSDAKEAAKDEPVLVAGRKDVPIRGRCAVTRSDVPKDIQLLSFASEDKSKEFFDYTEISLREQFLLVDKALSQRLAQIALCIRKLTPDRSKAARFVWFVDSGSGYLRLERGQPTVAHAESSTLRDCLFQTSSIDIAISSPKELSSWVFRGPYAVSVELPGKRKGDDTMRSDATTGKPFTSATADQNPFAVQM